MMRRNYEIVLIGNYKFGTYVNNRKLIVAFESGYFFYLCIVFVVVESMGRRVRLNVLKSLNDYML